MILTNYFQDLKSIVLEVCKFLGKSLPDSVIDQIVAHSSFKSMKANPMSNPDTLKFNDPKVDGKLSFMRKGMSNFAFFFLGSAVSVTIVTLMLDNKLNISRNKERKKCVILCSLWPVFSKAD